MVEVARGALEANINSSEPSLVLPFLAVSFRISLLALALVLVLVLVACSLLFCSSRGSRVRAPVARLLPWLPCLTSLPSLPSLPCARATPHGVSATFACLFRPRVHASPCRTRAGGALRRCSIGLCVLGMGARDGAGTREGHPCMYCTLCFTGASPMFELRPAKKFLTRSNPETGAAARCGRMLASPRIGSPKPTRPCIAPSCPCR
jgi:hypothetical protein